MKQIPAILLLISFFNLRQTFEIQPRILNGIKTNSTEFPFYVHLDLENKTCGASLISDKWLITAAHCISTKENVDVFFGVDKYGEFTKGISVKPENQYIHPCNTDDHNDIGENL